MKLEDRVGNDAESTREVGDVFRRRRWRRPKAHLSPSSVKLDD
jgi:hypothetical protein